MALEYIKGKVTAVNERPTSAGTMYDIEIAGQRVGAGKYMPRVKAGGYYKLAIERNGKYINMARGTKPEPIDASDSDPVATPAAPSAGRSSYAAGDDKRQEAISRQAARNTAVEFMRLLAEKDALVLPAASAKSAARYEAMRATLEQLTNEFFAYSTGKDTKPEAAKEKEDDLAGNEEDFD